MTDELWTDEEWRATISSADQNDLPDSAFAYIEPGGTKDSGGKTVPRSLRHFCIVDAAHVRNALARAAQSPFGEKAMPKIKSAAKKFDIEVGESNAATDDTEARADDDDRKDCPTCEGTGKIMDGHRDCPDCTDGKVPAEKPKSRSASRVAERAEATYGQTEFREMPFTDAECRMDPVGGGMTFRGYASIFDAPYPINDAYGEYQETVKRGAFDKTLAEGADVVFLINHDGAPLARSKSNTLSVRTDGKGLLTEARLDPANPRAQELKSMIARGDMDEMSFTFRDLRPTWNDAYTERNLREVSIHHGDVSAVNFGANGATKGTLAMRSARWRQYGPDPGDFVTMLTELRAGATLSGTSAATLKHVLSLVAAADTAVDQAQPLLAELLGVPNPDIAQDAAMESKSATADTEARALGDVCNCCAPCTGASCDGTCCDPASRGAAPCSLNANVATSQTENPAETAPTPTSLAFDDFDYEARIRIARLKGAA